MVGLLRPTRGEVRALFGHSVFDDDRAFSARSVVASACSSRGVVLGAAGMFDNVAFPLRSALGGDEDLIREPVGWKLAMVELNRRIGKPMPG